MSPRPNHLTGALSDFSQDDIAWIASQFEIGDVQPIGEFADRGNINLHTFLVKGGHGGGRHEFLLQKLNTEVFAKPYRVMEAMTRWIQAQREYLARFESNDSGWEPITLIETIHGDQFLDLSDDKGWSVWRLMTRIPNTKCFKSLGLVGDRQAQLSTAREVGRGLALNADLVSQMPLDGLESSLPGYRDTAGYFRQFRSVKEGYRTLNECRDLLPMEDEVRESTQHLYTLAQSPSEWEARMDRADSEGLLDLIGKNVDFALTLQSAVAVGSVRKTAIHGDTKIENFLFDLATDKVKCLVDLDTIMPYTWLADWGDMMRSLCNVAGEKETDPDKVQVDREVYEAVTAGFLSTAKEATNDEIELMADAVAVIAIELGTRFLTDYLRGDNYFRRTPTDPEDLNLIRGRAQLTLFQRLMDARDWATDCIRRAAGA